MKKGLRRLGKPFTLGRSLLLLLVAVLAQALLTLVRSHLVSLMLLTVGHNVKKLKVYFSLTALTKLLAGLKAGMSWAGMVIVVLRVMLRAAF